jgi:hypothetical protein
MQLRNPFRRTARVDAPTPADPRAEAEALVEAGRWSDAVDLLVAANRARRAPELELRLIELRHEAAAHLDAGEGRRPWPPAYEDRWPALVGELPEIDGRDLDTDRVGGAVAHHGALVVRGLLDDAQVARAVDVVHRAQASRDLQADGRAVTDEDRAWYHPFETAGRLQQSLREMVTDQGGTWLADSPAGTAVVLDLLTDVGVVDVVTRHFGERPFFSLQKSTLRRSRPKLKLVAWHQDGSFLDADVRTMNTWIALSPCGGTYPSPGLEVVPRRVPEVLPVDGELTPHSVSPTLVAEVAAETPTVCPAFAPGDAMLFDERFLHRTHLAAEMTEDRYALECWFFAPSHPSSGYLPLLV